MLFFVVDADRCFGSACFHWSPQWLRVSRFPSIACVVRHCCFLRSLPAWWLLHLVVTESWWHRRLRRLRSEARTALRSSSWKTWSRHNLRKALRILQIHHGSRPPKRFISKMLQRQANLQQTSMWTCRFCQVKHSCTQTHCESCNRHWKQAEATSGPRSQSRRSRRPRRANQEQRKAAPTNGNSDKPSDTDKDGKLTVTEEEIFTTKHPWVANSPHTRVPPVDNKSAVADEAAMPIPPEPKAQVPPTGEEDAAKLHQHLKALKTALGSLPAELEAKLILCEEKLREKALSHGHLNRLGKVNKQMKTIMSKLQAMDEGWQQFAKKVMEKFEEHRKMYHSSREQLMKEYLAKAEELQAAKEEVQFASQQLLAEPPTAPALHPRDDATTQMEQAMQEDEIFQQSMFDGYIGHVETVEDEEDELMTEKPLPKTPARDPRQPFGRKMGSSPSKVANIHLKMKESDKSRSPNPANK